MGAHLNISALARRTGVAPDTLRKWESRYEVLRPERTTGGQRRYTEHDVLRVEWLRDRLAEGWRIGEAARLLDEVVAPPLERPEALLEALVDAVGSDEPALVGALLDQAFSVLSVTVALEEVVTPMLRWIGDEWRAGRLSVAHEHAATGRVRARLESLLADRRGGPRGTAVLACAPGERHDVGLLMVAVALRADGWRVEYLGPDTPLAQALDFAASLGAATLCVSATRVETLDALTEAAATISAPPGVRLVVGGAGVDRGAARALGAQHVDGRLDRVAERVREVAA